jgi:copper chaperone NosL
MKLIEKLLNLPFFQAIALFLLAAVLSFSPAKGRTQPLDTVEGKSRCPVCGMFVAKYPNWIAQIRADEKTFLFDGVKDLLVFYFTPLKFDGPNPKDIKEIWVKDYYSLSWINGREALYVYGSDVFGPMGHELIPFSSREAAESFMADHKGKAIYQFPDITPELIESMRHGQRMR